MIILSFSFVYIEPTRRENTCMVLDWCGMHKISCPHQYIVFTLLNTTLQLDFTSFFSKRAKKSLSARKKGSFFSPRVKIRAFFEDAQITQQRNFQRIYCLLHPYMPSTLNVLQQSHFSQLYQQHHSCHTNNGSYPNSTSSPYLPKYVMLVGELGLQSAHSLHLYLSPCFFKIARLLHFICFWWPHG